MRIVQAEIIIFHFPVGKFALAGGEFFPKGADIAAVLHRQMGGAAVIGKKLPQRLFESGGGFRLGGNGGGSGGKAAGSVHNLPNGCRLSRPGIIAGHMDVAGATARHALDKPCSETPVEKAPGTRPCPAEYVRPAHKSDDGLSTGTLHPGSVAEYYGRLEVDVCQHPQEGFFLAACRTLFLANLL